MKWVFLVAVVIVGVLVLAQAVGHTQPLPSQPAYTTFDPDGVGLATPDGRYSLTLVDGCTIEPLVNVSYLSNEAGLPIWVGSPDGSLSCGVSQATKIADVPCFTNDDGICDASSEHN